MKDNEIKLDAKKVQALTKKLDEQYGETVLSPDDFESHEELEAILKHNENAKILHAQRRDEERCNAPSLYSKFKNGIKKLFGQNQAKQKQIEQSQQKSR